MLFSLSRYFGKKYYKGKYDEFRERRNSGARVSNDLPEYNDSKKAAYADFVCDFGVTQHNKGHRLLD